MKKIYDMLRAPLILALVFAALIASFLPICTMNSADMFENKTLQAGEFEIDLYHAGKIKYGLGEFLKSRDEDIDTLIDLYIKGLEANALRIRASSAESETAKEFLINKWENEISKIKEIENNLSETDKERIEEKLNDPDFLSKLAFRLIYSNREDGADLYTKDEENLIYKSPIYALLISKIGIFVAPLILVVLAAIELLKLLKTPSEERKSRFLNINGAIAVVSALAVVVATMIATQQFSKGTAFIGSCFVVMVILAILTCAIDVFGAFVNQEYFDKKKFITKQVLAGIALVLVVCVSVLVFRVVGTLSKEINEHAQEYISTYTAEEGRAYAERMGTQPLDSWIDDYEDYVLETARKTKTNVLMIESFMVFVPLLIGWVILTVPAIVDKIKLSEKSKKDLGSPIPWLIILAVAICLPLFVFHKPTYEAKIDSYKEGKFAITFAEHEEENTTFNFQYTSLKTRIDDLKEKINNTDDTLEKQQYEIELEGAESKLKRIERTSPINSIASAALIVVLLVIVGVYCSIDEKYYDIDKLQKEREEREAAKETF